MKDLLTSTSTGDIQISGGDLVLGLSNAQHQEHLLIAQRGSIKQFPEAGVGIINYINEGDIDVMLREIRYQFEKDGMAVESISFDPNTGKLTHDAKYNS